MPGRICAVPVCKNNQLALKKQGSSIVFHPFPKGTSQQPPDSEAADFSELQQNVPAELVFTSSDKNPEQLCVFNESSQVGVVFDSDGGRYGIVDGARQKGVVMDQNMGVGVEINRDNYNFNAPFKDNVKNTDLNVVLNDNAQTAFDVNVEWSVSLISLVKELIGWFSQHFLIDIMKLGVTLAKGLWNMFNMITLPIRRILKPILIMNILGWQAFSGGFIALLNIFKWMGILCSNVVGGVAVLVINSIRIHLAIIINCLDGARAFFYILDEILKRINPLKILQVILTSPYKIVQFIVGLGGRIFHGISGLFLLIFRLFTFQITIDDLVGIVTTFIRFVINFINERSVTRIEVEQFSARMLDVPEESQKLYGSTNDYDDYKNFFLGLSNKKPFHINNLNLGSFVDVIVSGGLTGTKLLGKVLGVFQPVISLGSAIPKLFSSMVRSLKDVDGRAYVQKVVDNVTIPVEGPVIDSYISLRAGESSVDDLQGIPVIKDIYKAFEDLSLEKTGVPLKDLLKDEHVVEVFGDIAELSR